MGRQIRFRAWDTVRNEYLSAGEVLLAVQPHNMPRDTEVYIDTLRYQDTSHRMVLEQFTGLHDKNSREIYEGDIIASENIVKPGAVVQWSETDASWSVGEGWPFAEYYDGVEGIRQCEVIGNVHENPELLEKPVGLKPSGGAVSGGSPQ